jgi:hypothetical protein
MLNIFNSNQPFIKIIIVLVNFLIWIPRGIVGYVPETEVLWSWMEPLTIPLVNASLCAVFITAVALAINFMVGALEFELRGSHIPAFSFSVICSTLLFESGFHLVLVAIIPLLISIFKILSVYRESKAFPKYFEAGFWLGVSILLYKPFVLLLPIYILTIAYTRTFSWREWFLPVVGVITPPAIWVQLEFLRTGEFTIMKMLALEWNLHWTYDFTHWLVIVCWLLMALVALRTYWATYGKSTNKSKNTKNGFLILSIGLILCVGLSEALNGFTAMVPFAISISVLMAFLFSGMLKRIWSTSLFILFLIPFIAILLVGYL